MVLEDARARAVTALGLMNTLPEEEFDELAQLAALSCGAPMSQMNLLDGTRQWSKATVGMPNSDCPIELSFCAHAIKSPESILVIEDTWQDERFVNNPFVTGNPNIRFYAGVPINTPDGFAAGTLCVIDTVPRQLTAVQEMALRVLGRQVMARMELRQKQEALQRALKEREAAETQLRTSDQLFRAFMDASPFVSYIKDSERRYVFYNKRYCDSFNVTQDWLIGRTDEDVFSPALCEDIRATDLEALSQEGIVESLTPVETPSGTVDYWKSFKFRCYDAAGQQNVAGISQNITAEYARDLKIREYQDKLEEANKLLAQLAVTDSLTGLSNRRSFDQRLEIDFSMARRRHRPLSVVLLDIDNFKRLNDTLGHAEGDFALRRLAMLLQQTVRLTDHAARYGGEEFTVILPETDTASALLWAERLRVAIRDFEWGKCPMTVSIGIATIDDTVRDGAELIERADQALYAAKHSGKDCALSFDCREIIPNTKRDHPPQS